MFSLLPSCFLGDYFQRGRVADEFVQSADEVCEAGTRGAVLLPAVQHELVQVGGAVGRRGQPVVLLDGIDYLTVGDKQLLFKQSVSTK